MSAREPSSLLSFVHPAVQRTAVVLLHGLCSTPDELLTVQSALRDGGYDVSDYHSILPEFGTIEEFRELVTKAHERNMRVIIDLPLNHTSDQHEWFQQSRLDPEGPYGDFYVWSDSDEKFDNIRIIFTDYEESNWAFDSERRQFYFHRFFSHQPDLNFDNPKVLEETAAQALKVDV